MIVVFDSLMFLLIQRMKAIEKETQTQEEPERPLKRLRLRHQDGQSSPSSPNSNGALLKRPKLEVDEVPEPVSPLKRKGKQSILPNDLSRIEGSDIIYSGDVVVADATGSIETSPLLLLSSPLIFLLYLDLMYA